MKTLFRHPESERPVMCMHLGIVDGVYQHYGTPQQTDFPKFKFIEEVHVIRSFRIEASVLVIYVPVLCALCSVMGYYGPTVLIVGR